MNIFTKGQKGIFLKVPLFLGTLASCCSLGLFAQQAWAEALVKTIGGGPTQENRNAAGNRNGSTFLESQFNGPSGLAADSFGLLYIADKTNGAIRKISFPGSDEVSLTTTIIGNLNAPVAVAFDSGNSLYVLTQGDGRITRYSRFGNFQSIKISGLSSPTALALDSQTNFYVTELNGSVKRFRFNGALTFQTGGFNQPRGIAVFKNGDIAVSDTLNHAIKVINPASGVVKTLTGGHGAGFADGQPNVTRFNQPHNLFRTTDGSLIVADRYNHRVRMVDAEGRVSTIYGIDPTDPAWSTNGFPGWSDGVATIAAARQPYGVTFTGGALFTTEANYHIVRMITGVELPGGGPDTGGGNTNAVTPPTISPKYGYFPMGQEILVQTELSTVFYTIDGSEPTTNSIPVSIVNNQGTIFWRNTIDDLTSLKLKAFNGTNASVTVQGEKPPANFIGITKNISGGAGSTVVVPVVLTVRTNIKSILFRVEVTPNNGAPPIDPDEYSAISISRNDFVSVASPSQGSQDARFSVIPYQNGVTRGLAVVAIGTNSFYEVKSHAVAALLRIPIPANAVDNQTYTIAISRASATSDGGQTEVPLVTMNPRTLVVRTIPYIVGDVSPAFWYDAGEFGDGDLNNSDVNTMFYAINGIRRPYTFSDAFAAMDAFPPDSTGSPGGDGEVDFQDFSVILNRTLGIDPENWARLNIKDEDGRILFNFRTNLLDGQFSSSAKPSRTKSISVNTPALSDLWIRQASIGAGVVLNAKPNSLVKVPIYLKIFPGFSISGLNFRAAVHAKGNAQQLSGVSFLPAQGIPDPPFSQQVPGALNELISAWTLGSFSPKLIGSNLLGHLVFQLPFFAAPGDSYDVRISFASGASDLTARYRLESIPGSVWVLVSPETLPEPISDEWKQTYFGSITNFIGNALEDTDGDGISNWQEYLSGTNPTNALSKLQFYHSFLKSHGDIKNISLQWLTIPGRIYVLECSQSLDGGWIPVSTKLLGDGGLREFTVTNLFNGEQFYRITLQP